MIRGLENAAYEEMLKEVDSFGPEKKRHSVDLVNVSNMQRSCREDGGSLFKRIPGGRSRGMGMCCFSGNSFWI